MASPSGIWEGGTMAVISIPKVLRDKLTDEGADALVQIFDKVESETHKVTLEVAEERIEGQLAKVEGNREAKIAQSSAALETKMANMRADLIRWMFIFWVGQVGTITAILFAFFKK